MDAIGASPAPPNPKTTRETTIVYLAPGIWALQKVHFFITGNHQKVPFLHEKLSLERMVLGPSPSSGR